MHGHLLALVALLRLVFSKPVAGGFGEDAGRGRLAEFGSGVRLLSVWWSVGGRVERLNVV